MFLVDNQQREKYRAMFLELEGKKRQECCCGECFESLTSASSPPAAASPSTTPLTPALDGKCGISAETDTRDRTRINLLDYVHKCSGTL